MSMIDMNRAAKIIGTGHYITAEKFLTAEGVKPVGEVRRGKGFARFYDEAAVRAAAKGYDEYHTKILHRRAKAAAAAAAANGSHRKPNSAKAERNVQIVADFKSGMTDKQLGEKYGVSAVRIFQIRAKAGMTGENSGRERIASRRQNHVDKGSRRSKADLRAELEGRVRAPALDDVESLRVDLKALAARFEDLQSAVREVLTFVPRGLRPSDKQPLNPVLKSPDHVAVGTGSESVSG